MDRLAVIIAEMIRSALSWEQEHGLPQYDNRKIGPQKPLTIIGVTDTLKASDVSVKGDSDEHKNNGTKYAS